jgi:soluble lytic murein transglycosylase-like protein
MIKGCLPYRIKLKLLLFSLLSIFFILVTLTSYAYAQSWDDRSEKQLKIFQLSYLLEQEDSFSAQNVYFNNALSYFENEHFGMAIGELEKIEYSNLYLPLYLKSQLLKGQCYEKQQRWDSAIRVYQGLITEVPLLQDYTIYLLGNCYLNTKDISNAQKSFQKLIEEYPESAIIPSVHYQLALLYLNNNQLEQFYREGRLVLEISQEEKLKAKVLSKMSDVLWEEGQLFDSLLLLKELIENRYERERISILEDLFVHRFQIAKDKKGLEMPPDLTLFCAEILFNYRQYKTAELFYEEIIAKYAHQIDLAQVNYDKARAIYYQGEYERAIDQCLYILENFAQEEIIVRTLYLYAGALLSTGNRDLAGMKYYQIIEKYPENYFAQASYLRLSEIEFLQNKEEEGVKILNQLLSKYPESSPAQEAAWILAHYYTDKNLIKEALQYYQFIYEYFPQSEKADDALYWMGKLLYPLDENKGAQWYERLLKQYPDSYYSFRLPVEISKSYHNLENIIAQSKKITEEKLRKDYFPGDRVAQLSAYKAELLFLTGYYQESIWEISYALKQEPQNIYAQFLLTKAYAEADHYYRSISYAQMLLNYFLNNNKEQIPLAVWEYAFPTYYYSLVRKIAADYYLDPYLIWATIREESHFNPYSESKAGARGLMQIVFSTGDWIAQKLNYKEFEYDLLFEPEVNIKFGGWYLQYLQERFEKNIYLIVSGYNAGPGITSQWIEKMDVNDLDVFVENIPYPETSEHIKKVIRSYLIYQIIYKN